MKSTALSAQKVENSHSLFNVSYTWYKSLYKPHPIESPPILLYYFNVWQFDEFFFSLNSSLVNSVKKKLLELILARFYWMYIIKTNVQNVVVWKQLRTSIPVFEYLSKLSGLSFKVQILWECHIIWKNLPFFFEIYLVTSKKVGDFFKFLWPSHNIWIL